MILTDRQKVILKDALYNLHPASGGNTFNPVYGRGLLVGTVSGLMAAGALFPEALRLCCQNLPKGFSRDCIPMGWEEDVEKYLPDTHKTTVK